MSLQSSMVGLMGEMLQQMKEQNRQQAEYHRSTLAPQKEQNDRMYELCKLALSQQREALAPTTLPAQVTAARRHLQRAPVKVKCKDDSLAYLCCWRPHRDRWGRRCSSSSTGWTT